MFPELLTSYSKNYRVYHILKSSTVTFRVSGLTLKYLIVLNYELLLCKVRVRSCVSLLHGCILFSQYHVFLSCVLLLLACLFPFLLVFYVDTILLVTEPCVLELGIEIPPALFFLL